MSLWKNIYDRLHPAPPKGAPLSTPETQAEAQNALVKASTDLTAVRGREPKVSELTRQLRGQMDRNHFGELVEASMRRS